MGTMTKNGAEEGGGRSTTDVDVAADEQDTLAVQDREDFGLGGSYVPATLAWLKDTQAIISNAELTCQHAGDTLNSICSNVSETQMRIAHVHGMGSRSRALRRAYLSLHERSSGVTTATKTAGIPEVERVRGLLFVIGIFSDAIEQTRVAANDILVALDKMAKRGMAATTKLRCSEYAEAIVRETTLMGLELQRAWAGLVIARLKLDSDPACALS